MNHLQQIPVLDSVLKHVPWAGLVDGCRFVCKSWHTATMREISRRICTAMRNVPMYTSRFRLHPDTRPQTCSQCEKTFAATDVIWRLVRDGYFFEDYAWYVCEHCRGAPPQYSIAFDENGRCMQGAYTVTYAPLFVWSLPYYGVVGRYGHKGYPLHNRSDPHDPSLIHFEPPHGSHRGLYQITTIDTKTVEVVEKDGVALHTFEWLQVSNSPTGSLLKVPGEKLATMAEIARGYLGQITDWLPIRMRNGTLGLLCINRDHHLYGKCMSE